MRSRLLALLMLLSAGHMALAQCTSPTLDQQQTMQSLLDKIQQLETRLSQVEEYQRKESATQLVRSTPEGTAERKAQQASVAPTQMAHEHEAVPEEVRETRIHYPSLQIRGFGDVDFSATDQKGSVSGFNLGQFVLHFASALSEKVSYFGEVSLTAQPTAYEVNVERTIIRYDYNDYFKMSFGKYHTPISYWNTAFHHGAWLQTTISRPQMVMFGGALIPIHFVGLQAEGNIPSGPLGLGYNLGLGNGRSSNFSKAGDSGDANNHRAWLANVFARPSWLNDLQFGGSYYHDLLTPQPGANFEERIASANVVYTREKPEILAEVANVHHRDLQTSQTFNTTAYYVQMAYRFPWQENKWKPYYRFEYIHRPSFEPVWDFAGEPSVADLVGSTVGVRYDITNYAAFKGEYRRFRQGVGEPSVNGAFFQTAFTF